MKVLTFKTLVKCCVVTLIYFMSSILMLTPAPVLANPALVFEASSGKILYAEDADRLWYPASLTKMMTAYLAFEDLRKGKISLKEYLTCSDLAHAQPPSKVGLNVGGQMTVDTGIQALIVKSANDVAVMLAEKMEGDIEAFAKRMNATAKRLGMSQTRYYNPNGLPDGRQVTTARDQGLLAQAIIKDFPEYAHYFFQMEVKIGKKSLRTHNDLLRKYQGTDGMKTGFVCASGFNVVASATRNNRRLVAVVFGSPNSARRRVRAVQLFDHAFETYEWKDLLQADLITKEPQLDPRGPKNMRYFVSSWSCGGRRAVAAHPKKGNKQQDKKVNAKKEETGKAGQPKDAAKKDTVEAKPVADVKKE